MRSGLTQEEKLKLSTSAEIARDIFVNVLQDIKHPDHIALIQLEFYPYVGLRSTIRLNPKKGLMRVRLSDMLADAPENIIKALAVILLCKLNHNQVPHSANETYQNWSSSPEIQHMGFVTRSKRGRKKLLHPKGQAYDLEAIFDRLNEHYFAAELRKPSLGWSPSIAWTKLGHYDPTHDAIAVSRIFDMPDTPQVLLEYVMYHEMLHIKYPVKIRANRRQVHTPEFKKQEQQFAHYEEAMQLLGNLCLYS